jgi:hypothetical protein
LRQFNGLVVTGVQTAVFFVAITNGKTGFFGLPTTNQSFRIVGRTVINDEPLKIMRALPLQAFVATVNAVFAVICGSKNGDEFFCHYNALYSL